MAVGDVMKEENLIVEVFTVASAVDIELGEIVWNSGSGIIAATVHSTVRGPYFMARKEHDYSAETDHDIPCVVVGLVDAQVTPSATIPKGRYLEIDSDGDLDILDYTSATGWYEIAAISMDELLTTDTHGLVLLGTFP